MLRVSTRSPRWLLVLLFPSLLSGAARARQSDTAPGEIRGSVIPRPHETRLVVNRYPGAEGGNLPREVVPIPAVAYVEGPGLHGGAGPTVSMAQRDTSFAPPLLVVPAGTTVSFPNEDPFFHNVFSYSHPKRFDLGRYPNGDSRSVLFDRPGPVKIFCEVHRWMRAAVLVVGNPFYAVVSEDGGFRISGLPPGRYTLVVWDFDRGEVRQPVEVPPGGTVEVEVRL